MMWISVSLSLFFSQTSHLTMSATRLVWDKEEKKGKGNAKRKRQQA